MVNLHLEAESLCLLILYKDIENNSIDRRMISLSDLHLGGFRSICGCSDKANQRGQKRRYRIVANGVRSPSPVTIACQVSLFPIGIF